MSWRCPEFPCNVIIYRIYWEGFEPNDCYVGHTRRRLDLRMNVHRSAAKRGETADIQEAIRTRPPFKVETLEVVFCQDKKEACGHERRLKWELNAQLNMIEPFETAEERKEKSRVLRANPEFKARRKVYFKTRNAKPENKARVKAHKEKPEVKARNKLTDKALQSKNRAERRFVCDPCNYVAGRKAHLTQHFKTKQHQRLSQLS